MGFETSHADGDVKSPLIMSDDAVAEMTFPSAGESDELPGQAGIPSETDEAAEATASEDDTANDQAPDADDGDSEEASTGEGGADGDDEDDRTDYSTPTDDDDDDGERSPDEESSDSADDEEGDDSESDSGEVDYKSEYTKLLSSFRANGKDMKIDNVDDARKLMAMGANYNKKMTALKPNLTLMKMLENNDLLDEGKLSYLIDLDKKDPAAITKLLHDSKLNPLDINVDEASSYQPNTYTVGGNEVELDSVLAELRDTSGYDTTIGIIGNKWDESSKVVLMKDPSMIRVINEHVESGVYDKVNAEVEKQRMLGQLNGLSDVEAYKQVGYQMRDQGAFNVQAPATSAPKPKPVKAKAANPKLKNKKRAASGTRSTPGKGKSTDFNPLNMSDADFLAQMDAKFN